MTPLPPHRAPTPPPHKAPTPLSFKVHYDVFAQGLLQIIGFAAYLARIRRNTLKCYFFPSLISIAIYFIFEERRQRTLVLNLQSSFNLAHSEFSWPY